MKIQNVSRFAYRIIAVFIALAWLYVLITYLWGAVIYILIASLIAGLWAYFYPERRADTGESELLSPSEIAEAAQVRRALYRAIDKARSWK